ncbi:hypothetical protein D3C72_1678510 [compost metagenome]
MVVAGDLELAQSVAQALEFAGEDVTVIADRGDPARLKALAQRIPAVQVLVHGFPLADVVDDRIAAIAGFVGAALAAQFNGHAMA